MCKSVCNRGADAFRVVIPLPANHLQTGWEQARTHPTAHVGALAIGSLPCAPASFFIAICLCYSYKRTRITFNFFCNTHTHTHTCLLLVTHLAFTKTFLSRKQEASRTVSQKVVVTLTRKLLRPRGLFLFQFTIKVGCYIP